MASPDRPYLEARKRSLLAKLGQYWHADETGYKALNAAGKREDAQAKAKLLETTYRELADVTAELGERDFSRSAQEYARNMAMENDPSLLREEIKAKRHVFLKTVEESMKVVKDADAKDSSRLSEYTAAINAMRSDLSQLRYLLELAKPRDKEDEHAINIEKQLAASVEPQIEKHAEALGVPPMVAPAEDWRTLAAPPEDWQSYLEPQPAQATSAENTPPTARTSTHQAFSNISGPDLSDTTPRAPVSIPLSSQSNWASSDTEREARFQAGEQAAREYQREAERLHALTPHRRTRITALDALKETADTEQTRLGGFVDAYQGEFKVRQSDHDSSVFWFSSANDTYATEIPVVADPNPHHSTTTEDIKDLLGKNKNQIIAAHILKKRGKDGTPLFVVHLAKPWRDPDKGVKTTVYDPKTKGPKPQTIKYDKYVYQALNSRHTSLSDVLAQKTRLELLSINTAETAHLLKLAGSLKAFKNNLVTGNLDREYDNAIQGIVLQKRRENPEWLAKYQKEWIEKNPGADAAAIPATERDAVLQQIFENQTKDKDFFALLACDFPGGPLEYEFGGEKKSIKGLGHNLMFDDDLQFFMRSGKPLTPEHTAIWEALQKDPEKLLAFALNQAMLRSVIAHGAKTSALVDKITGERVSILTDIKAPGIKDSCIDNITYEHRRLAVEGILFTPRSVDDEIVPGYNKREALENAQELLQEQLTRTLSKAQIRAGAVVVNPLYLNDPLSQTSSKDISLAVPQANPSSREEIIHDTEDRLQRLTHKELPKNLAQLTDAINGVRQENGLPAIGRLPVEDWKATIGVFEIVASSIIKGFTDMHGDYEKISGFF